MRPVSPLYIGVAAPLMEMAHVWMARMADYPDMRARLTRLKDFPRRDINAYAIQFLEDDRTVLSFRTSVSVHVERVRTAIEQWLGTAPELLPTPYVETITGLDHQRALIELQDALQGQPVRLVRRIGLTLQQLQYDLAEYRPHWCSSTATALGKVVCGSKTAEPGVRSSRASASFLCSSHGPMCCSYCPTKPTRATSWHSYLAHSHSPWRTTVRRC